MDKWALFRDLTTARAAFGLAPRTLSVLNALLSFHPRRELSSEASLIVFPSNRSLAERCHGMSEATLRRHLSALVEAGFLVRHDSPNGKRYARRGEAGQIVRAFGFDLRPLLNRCVEISEAADAAIAAEEDLRLLREAVVLKLRDVAKLFEYRDDGCLLPAEARDLCDDTRKLLRRKPEAESLELRLTELTQLTDEMMPETPESTGNGAQNERHYQNSDPDHLKKETTTLHDVLQACPTISTYATDRIEDWTQFQDTTTRIAPWLGIAPKALKGAEDSMGVRNSAIAVAGILESAARIRQPAAYLRALSNKARRRTFTPEPMIAALLNRSLPGRAGPCGAS